jgi:Holliday junction resolvase RusA-like endonuclease
MTKRQPRQIHLTIPSELVPSLNVMYSANHRQRARIARQAHADIGWHVRATMGSEITPLPGPVLVCITAYGAPPKDADNYLKTLLDGLVIAGVLKDDGYKYLSELRVRVRKSSKQDARIEVHIQNFEGVL